MDVISLELCSLGDWLGEDLSFEERTSGGSTVIEPSLSVGDRYPALLRYWISPVTVEMLADQPVDQHVWWETTHVVENGSVVSILSPASGCVAAFGTSGGSWLAGMFIR